MQGIVKFEAEETAGRSTVVAESEVGRFPGWRVAAVLYADRLETGGNTEREMDTYGNWTGKTVEKSHVVVVSEPRFLLVQDTESAIAELTEERNVAQQAVRDTEKLFRDAEARAVKFEKELAEAEAKRQSWEKTVTSLRMESEELRTGRRKLEGDIAKIRTAIGEKQMKEILNPTV